MLNGRTAKDALPASGEVRAMTTRQLTEQELIDQYIERNPHKPGVANARLKRYGVAVWALVGLFKGTNGDIAQVAQDYGVPVEAVQAALAYYRRHQAEVDARIAGNLSDDV
jgi:uncharacterized protein (DUF433 family)